MRAGAPRTSSIQPFLAGTAAYTQSETMVRLSWLMKPNLAQLASNRKKLVSALCGVRQHSMRATHSGDYRTVAKLTVDAARINTAIAELDVAELLTL